MGFRQWLGSLISGKTQEQYVASATDDSSEEELSGLNFRSAIEVHQAWRYRLQSVIDGSSTETLVVETVSKDDQCDLGKWLHGSGSKQFGQDSLFQQLIKNHAHFHTCAGHVLNLKQDGQVEQAQESIRSGDFVRASQSVIMNLAQMYSKAKSA